MATVIEELIIALRADGGKLREELAKLLNESKRTGRESEQAMRPFQTALERVRAEVRAGLRPLAEYRDELKRQEAQLRATAAAQDKNSAEYRRTVDELAAVKRELAQVTTELSTQETRLTKLGGSLTRWGGALSIGVTAPLALLGGTGLRSAQQLEVFQQTLDTLIGDADRARAVFEELYEFDTQTTFAWPNLSKAVTLLAAFDTEAEDILPTLARLGDIASGVNMQIDELAELYGKARVQGRLFAQDINQLQGRGIPIVQELARQFGVTEDQVRELVAEGRVGFAELERAIIALTEEGGKFHGLMQAQTDTSAGRMMALRKEFEQVTDLIGQTLIPHVDKGVTAARSLVEWFVNLDERTQSLIVNFGLFAAASGPLLIALGQTLVAVQRVTGALAAARAAGLLAFGPAGWVVLGATVVLGLAGAFSGRRDSLDAAVERARDALAGGDTKSLLTALEKVEQSASGDVKTAIAELREEIERTGEVAEETRGKLAALLTDAQVAPLQAQLAALRVQRESLLERRGMIATPAAFDPAATEAEIERLRAEGNALLDAGREAEAAAIAERIRVLEASLYMSEAEWERTRRQSEAMLANVDGQIAAVDAQIADIEARLAALTGATPDTAQGGATPTATPAGATTGTGKKSKTKAEVLADLEEARRVARETAVLHGETLEALAAETQANIAATSRAINALLSDLGLDAADEDAQRLAAELRALEAEAERLRDATTPRKLGAQAVAEVDEVTREALKVMSRLDDALAAIESRRAAGFITDAQATREELKAVSDALDDLSGMYTRLAPEHQAYYRDLTLRNRELEAQVHRIEAAEQRAARARQYRVEQQMQLDHTGAAPTFASREEQREWLAARREQRNAALRARNERIIARRELVAEAHRFGVDISEAMRQGSEEGLRELEASLVARLDELGDDPSAAPFMGLLTRVRIALAEIEAEIRERERRVANMARLNRDPARLRDMRAAEVLGPSAGMATGMTPEEIADALRASPAGRRAREAAYWADVRYRQGVLQRAWAAERDGQEALGPSAGMSTGFDTPQALFQAFPALQRRQLLAQLAEDMAMAELRAQAFGDELGGAEEKARLLQSAVTALLSLGLAPTSDTIQQLVDDMQHWQGVIDEAAAQEARVQRFQDAVETARASLGELPGPLKANIATLREYRDSLDMSEEGAAELAAELDRLIAGLERLQAIEDSNLAKLAEGLGDAASISTGLAAGITRASVDVAEGLSMIADEGETLPGVARVIAGVATALETVAQAAEDGGLSADEAFDLLGGIASVAGEVIGTLTGIPGLGQVVAASFELVKAAIGDVSDDLAEIREQVDQTARRSTYLSRDLLQSFADEYTRRVSRGGIAGSFGATKAELDEEAFDAAVSVAESFGAAIASALSGADWREALDLGLDRMIRDQLIEAFILSPEVQTLIRRMVEFWQTAWEDGQLSTEELAEWERLRAELLAAGEAARKQLEELGLLDDEKPEAPRSTGARITELTGPSRDFFADLLAPLRNLGAQLSVLQDIRNILAARLPAGGATIGAGGVTITGPITITAAGHGFDARALFDELSRIAQRRARGV